MRCGRVHAIESDRNRWWRSEWQESSKCSGESIILNDFSATIPCTAQHNNAQHSTAQHSTAQHTAQH